MIDPITGWLSAGVRIATPVAWAALGETVAERAGVINLGLEGAMLAGALGATLGASRQPRGHVSSPANARR